MSIPILVVEMPQIIPFPVYGQTGNGIMIFWNWFCGHLELRINFGFHVHTHFGSPSSGCLDMNYTSTPWWPAWPWQSSPRRRKFELSLLSYSIWKRRDKSVTDRHTHILLRLLPYGHDLKIGPVTVSRPRLYVQTPPIQNLGETEVACKISANLDLN